jgi:dihydrofolate synthase/folylpolyglutamate synthase
MNRASSNREAIYEIFNGPGKADTVKNRLLFCIFAPSMNYKQTIEYLYSQLPMFHRDGPPAYKEGLDNTLAICNLLENPQDHFKSIHIAGTNGKGSVAHMLAAIFQKCGYKTGLYTSPHLKDFRERIKINGKEIPQKYVCDFVEKYKSHFDTIKPSFFEMTVGLAFDYFRSEKINIAIIETGLGGRLDSTNVINPVLSVITNIGLDHTDLLGDTIEKIALEKAGIIKKKCPVVIGESGAASAAVFKKKAKEMGAPVYFADRNYQAEVRQATDKYIEVDIIQGNRVSHKNFRLDLTGLYQLKNIVTTIQAIEVLKSMGYVLFQDTVKDALKDVKRITGFRGRWDVTGTKPLTVFDVAHNSAGMKELFSQVLLVPHKKLHIVFGAVRDKDISSMLSLLPKDASYYFCKSSIPRSLDENRLAEKARQSGLHGTVYNGGVQEALNAAKKNAAPDDMILVTGSTFVVAEAFSS